MKKLFGLLLTFTVFFSDFQVSVSAAYNVCFYGSREGDGKNFGDQLNRNLLNFFKIKYSCVPVEETENIFIGSILSWKYKKNLNVWGAGLIYERLNFLGGLNVHCLRGEKTKSFIERTKKIRLGNCLLGDPALLCKHIFTEKEEKKYDVGIVCHAGDDPNSQYLKNIDLHRKSFTFIDVRDDPKEVCRKIKQCRFILSSSLHGLIVADSYGIPNRRFILATSSNPNNTRFSFKFEDYYSIYKGIVIPKAVDLVAGEKIKDEDIDRFTEEYNIPQDVIDSFCKKYIELIKSHFPKASIGNLTEKAQDSFGDLY